MGFERRSDNVALVWWTVAPLYFYTVGDHVKLLSWELGLRYVLYSNVHIQLWISGCELNSVSWERESVIRGGISPSTSHMNRVALLAHHVAKQGWVKHNSWLAGARVGLVGGNVNGICYGDHALTNLLTAWGAQIYAHEFVDRVSRTKTILFACGMKTVMLSLCLVDAIVVAV